MKPACLPVVCLLVGALLPAAAREPVAVDLYAGWAWSPFGTLWPSPYVAAPSCYSPFWPAYGWWYEAEARYRIFPAERLLRLPPDAPTLLPPPPGTAHTSLRDEARERQWDSALGAFLATLPAAGAALQAPATNAPAAR